MLRTASQCILENLLEAQELEYGKVDGGMEAETALVRSKRGVELDTVATVELNLAFVVFPGDTELDDTLGNGGNL